MVESDIPVLLSALNVARVSFKDEGSSYYPPRARWYSRIFVNAWRPVRRYIHLEKFLPPGTLSPVRCRQYITFTPSLVGEGELCNSIRHENETELG